MGIPCNLYGMKYLYLILLTVLFSCNNKSSQKQLYQDSAKMYLDSMVKYQPIAVVDEESAKRFRDSGFIMDQKYKMYTVMRDYYLEKAK